MRWLFFGLMLLHGIIHFMGFAKAFGLAELAELRQPVSRTAGGLWLLAGLVLVSAAGLFAAGVECWWMAGGAGLVLSQGLVFAAWGDARFGTIANALVLAGAVYAFASTGPFSFRAEYDREVDARMVASGGRPTLTAADLERLPEPVRCYIRQSGAVGRPRVQHFSAAWRGRIRGGPEEPWMEFAARQHNVVGVPARFFHMEATRSGLPVDVLHAFAHGDATMRVRLLSLFPIVDGRGPQMTRGETVTLFNDLAILAPGALVDDAIAWEPVDDRTARATYTLGENAVHAELTFNDRCELVDFVSDDRLAASKDGSSFTPMRWSTPLGEYRSIGDRRVAASGEGRWHPEDGPYTYIELELLELRIDGE
jgi:hypothetical protein